MFRKMLTTPAAAFIIIDLGQSVLLNCHGKGEDLVDGRDGRLARNRLGVLAHIRVCGDD